MTKNRLPLVDLLAKAGDPDFLRQAGKTVVQMRMEADVGGRSKRSPHRSWAMRDHVGGLTAGTTAARTVPHRPRGMRATGSRRGGNLAAHLSRCRYQAFQGG